MSKTIQELAQEMTKKEFMDYADKNELCPSKFNLKTSKDTCQEGLNIEECHQCWENALSNIQFKDNSLILFENRSLDILKALKESEESYKKLEEQRDKLKAELLKAMEEYNLDKWENSEFSVSYIAPTERTSVDSKKLQKLHPDIYTEVVKTSSVKASVRFKVK